VQIAGWLETGATCTYTQQDPCCVERASWLLRIPFWLEANYIFLRTSHFFSLSYSSGLPTSFHHHHLFTCTKANHASAKNISVRAEWLRQSGRSPSEPSETPRWRITPRPASMPRVALHIALRLPYRRFFSLCRSSILNKHSGVVANCDHTSEWVH